jgi:hypothetical protein
VHQHIEGVVGDVRLGRFEVLQKIEIWLSVGPHGHQLTIEHSVGGKIVERFGYVVELMIQHVLSAGVKCRLAASAHNLDSVSIELDLLCCVAVMLCWISRRPSWWVLMCSAQHNRYGVSGNSGFPNRVNDRAVILKGSPFVLKVKHDHAAPHLCIDLALWRGISFFLWARLSDLNG